MEFEYFKPKSSSFFNIAQMLRNFTRENSTIRIQYARLKSIGHTPYMRTRVDRDKKG